MTNFPSGCQVRLKNDPTRGGTLLLGEPIVMAGRPWVKVRMLNGEISSFPIESLERVIEHADPLDFFRAGKFAPPDWLRRMLTRIRVTGGLQDMIYSMEATDTEFHAHQFKPVLKILNSPTDSLLIADEVGLGKTIEAGLIWTELRARYDLRRLLVICPKTLCGKWRSELDRRFGVDAQIVDARGLLTLLTDEHRRQRGFAAISWYQALRPPFENLLEPPEKKAKTPRVALSRFFAEQTFAGPLFDLLVIDEAHYMRNPETAANKLGQLLQPLSAHRLFLSATPIHLKNRDLLALLRLLDPETFGREDTFVDILQANRPLVAARDLIMRPGTNAEDIHRELNVARQNILLRGNNQLTAVEQMLAAGPLTLERRSAIAWRLEQANLLAHVVTRTRRRDVEEFRVTRDVGERRVAMNDLERQFYIGASKVVTDYARSLSVSERFLLAQPQRLLTSSPAAAALYWSELVRKSEPPETEEDEEEQDDEDADDTMLDTRPLLARLCTFAKQQSLSPSLELHDTKYENLLELIEQVKAESRANKVIIFSSFRVTLKYLARRLHDRRYKALLLHGSIDESRDELLDRFRDDPEIDILLTSEVGSEGVDLQFCWALINYDLPWNPMRVEQRIGRIDRLGQERDKVVIRNILYRDTIDETIYDKLYLRLGLCAEALGEFEAVLGDPVKDITSIALSPDLTPEQKNQRIELAAQALENKKNEQEKLETEAGGLMAHGDFVLQKIRLAHHLNRWIGSDDVLIYVRDALARRYSGCEIEPVSANNDLYTIRLSDEARAAFAAFLVDRKIEMRTGLTNISSSTRYRFSSSVVRSRQRDIEVVSQVHPLVRFASMLDDSDPIQREGAFAAAVDVKDCTKLSISAYVLGIAKWQFGARDSQVLGYAAYSMSDRQLIDAAAAEELAHLVATRSMPLPNASQRTDLTDCATALEQHVFAGLQSTFESSLAVFEAEAKDRVNLQLATLGRHLHNQSEKLKALIARNELRGQASIKRANEGRLRALESRCGQRRAEIISRAEVAPSFSRLAIGLVQIV